MYRILSFLASHYCTGALLSLLFAQPSTKWSSSVLFPRGVNAAGWISQSYSLHSFRRSEVRRRFRRQQATKNDIGVTVGGARLSPNNESHRQQKDLLVIAWECCLVDTLEWRIETGLKAAFDVWPELEIMTMESSDLQWLYNKLSALQHVLTPPPPPSKGNKKHQYYSPAVEYGLAIRMLLEEQELDEGRSNGSKGKYGSRYHPSADDKAFASATSSTGRSANGNTAPATHATAATRSDNFNAQRRGRRQQRPLTVGEIAANWQETLREAAMIRYYAEDKENPLDQLHDAIVQIQAIDHEDDEEGVFKKLKLSADMEAMLQERFASSSSPSSSPSSSCAIIVTVHHEIDLPVARRSIESALFSLSSSLSSSSLPKIRVCESLSELSASDLQNESIWIVCTQNVNATSSSSSACSTMSSIMAACPEDTTVHVVESCWSLLEAYIPLFGEGVPRGQETIGECVLDEEHCENASGHDDTPGRRRFLQLCLCQWASHPDSQSAAIMNPWTTVMSLTDCQELVMARRISQ